MKQRVFLALLVIWLGAGKVVWAVEGMPEYTASPSAQPISFGCAEMVGEGDFNTVPAKVTFQMKVPRIGEVRQYRFHFGDGVVVDSAGARIEHVYTQGGKYLVIGEVQNQQERWETKNICELEVTIKSQSQVNEALACEKVLVRGDGRAAPAEVQIEVRGTGAVRGYRVVYHDSTSETDETKGVFKHKYNEPGTYQVRGYVRDEVGDFYGGEGECKQWVEVYAVGTTTTSGKMVGLVVVGLMLLGSVVGLGWWVRVRKRGN